MPQQTVLEFLENTKEYPKTITVERTTQSKYLFYLVVRAYHRRNGLKPLFFTYNKSEQHGVKAMIEEHSLFTEQGFFVLEGFSQAFVEQLTPPTGTYIVAETDRGELSAPAYSYRLRKEVIKLLASQLNVKLSLRVLFGMDWSMCRDYADYEICLRRAKVLGWTEEDVEKKLKETEVANVFQLIKRSQFKEFFALQEKYGATWLYNHIIEFLAQLIHYRALVQLGYDKERAGKELALGWYRVKELDEANNMMTGDDITKMAERILNLDFLVTRNREMGLALLALNSPLRISR